MRESNNGNAILIYQEKQISVYNLFRIKLGLDYVRTNLSWHQRG